MEEKQTQLEKWLNNFEEPLEASESTDLTDFAAMLEENEGR